MRFGLSLNDRHANFGGKKLFPYSKSEPPFWLEIPAFRQTYFSVYHMSDKTLPSYIRKLQSENYIYYAGFPSALNILSEFILSNSISINHPPRIITTGGESLLNYQKKNIESAFKCPVTDQYGAAEYIGNISTCEKGAYHTDFELGIFETEHSELNNEKEQCGSVIVTGLIDKAMPFLRYAIGDTITLSDHKCSCGRCGQTVLSIDGRSEGYILTPEGRKIGRLAHLFTYLNKVKESRITQTSINTAIIEIVPFNNYDNSIEIDFLNAFHHLVGNGISLEFQYVDSIRREKNGKYRAVVSLEDFRKRSLI